MWQQDPRLPPERARQMRDRRIDAYNQIQLKDRGGGLGEIRQPWRQVYDFHAVER